MEKIIKLFTKVKGNPLLLIFTIAAIIAVVLFLLVGAGALLIFGLNLLGLDIGYTLKTILGAIIVMACIKTFPGSKS